MKQIWLIPIALIAGCSGVRSPNLSVSSAAPVARSADGIALEFTVDAENPNDTGLPLRTVEYTVELDGKQVFKGTRAPEATLRRLGTQRLTLPAVANLAEHPELAGKGRVPYRINGWVTYVAPGQLAEIMFDAGVSVPSSSFEDSGELDLGS